MEQIVAMEAQIAGSLRFEENVTRGLIEGRLKIFLPMMNVKFSVEESDILVKKVWSQFNTQMQSLTTSLFDPSEDHIEWLNDARGTIKWEYWKRYEEHLLMNHRYPKKVITEIDRTTDKVLGFLEDPEREGCWDRRGMIVGHVQSGKTSNYAGLICKSIDAGYRVIIVLAGMHTSLRCQTQERLDQDVIGYDTSLNHQGVDRRIGAGKLNGFNPTPRIVSFTSSADNGDFNITTAKNLSYQVGQDPVLVVVKKNVHNLSHLTNFLKQSCADNSKFIADVPLLLIDDEADNASIDGKAVPRDEEGNPLKDEDPTAINRKIRGLLNMFQKKVYVGYTATPFANIFIYPKTDDQNEYGKDLFPSSFILNLPPPDNYVGPVEVFGLDSDGRQKVALPITKSAEDYEAFFPDRHKKDFILPPGEMPESLRDAIHAFILSCAVRKLRGDGDKHSSMLIHVSRFTMVQDQVWQRVDEYIRYMRQELELHLADDLNEELKCLWEKDFIPTTKGVNSVAKSDYTLPTWEGVSEVLYQIAAKIDVRRIHGQARDALDYKNYTKGLSVIAIGGDKLSRGLTLEGLSVSYYLRASRMYDTLMQMGRWFGYRDNYLDVCRLYTTDQLVEWYSYIALASEELREEFDRMDMAGATPREFGMRVKNHPGVLQVTAANKLRNGTRMTVTFSDSLCETVHFKEQESSKTKNYNALVSFLGNLKAPSREKNHFKWRTKTSEPIIEFLSMYDAHEMNRRSSPSLMIDYIRAQNRKNELREWSVILINKTVSDPSEDSRVKLNEDVSISVVTRTEIKENKVERRFSLRNRHLISADHESLDLGDYEDEALEITNELRKKDGRDPVPTPSGATSRYMRSKTQRGLILLYVIKTEDKTVSPFIGYAISFPGSEKAEYLEYIVDTTYWKRYYGND